MVQAGAVESLACGAVKQNGVTLGFPNRGDFHGTGTMQAKENAARLSGTHKNALRHAERV